MVHFTPLAVVVVGPCRHRHSQFSDDRNNYGTQIRPQTDCFRRSLRHAVDPSMNELAPVLLPRNQQLALAVQTSNSLTYKSFGELSSTYLHPRRSPKSSSSGEIILLLECSSPVLIVEEPGQIGRLLQVSISYPATLSSNSA